MTDDNNDRRLLYTVYFTYLQLLEAMMTTFTPAASVRRHLYEQRLLKLTLWTYLDSLSSIGLFAVPDVEDFSDVQNVDVTFVHVLPCD